MAFMASKTAMCTMAIARLDRPGPTCSPKTRLSPGGTGVWSRPLASMAISFQWWSRSMAPAPGRRCCRRSRRFDRAPKRGPKTSPRPPGNPSAPARPGRPRASVPSRNARRVGRLIMALSSSSSHLGHTCRAFDTARYDAGLLDGAGQRELLRRVVAAPAVVRGDRRRADRRDDETSAEDRSDPVGAWPPLPLGALTGLARIHPQRHVPVGVLVLEHELVALGDVVERIGVAEARIDLAVGHELRDVGGLRVVREMAALEALLAHPVIAPVHGRSVAGGASADHHHAPGRADEDRRGQGRLARVLEAELRSDTLAEAIPDRLAEGARTLGPLAVRLRVLGARHRAPVRELIAVDDRGRAVLLAELALGVVGDDGDGAATERARDLERHAAEAARGAPGQDDVAALDRVRRPPHEHPVRGGGAEEEASGLLPGQPRRLRHALVGLRARELGEAPVVGLITPDARALGEHRILARAHPGIVGTPRAAVPDDLGADLDVLHFAPDRPDDPRAVAATGVEVFGLACPLALGDNVERRAERGPHVVVVDAGGHHVDQHLVGAERRRGDDFPPPGVAWRAEAVLTHDVGVHPLRHFAERRSFTELTQIDHCGLFFYLPSGRLRRAPAPDVRGLDTLDDIQPLNSLTRRGSRGSSRPG